MCMGGGGGGSSAPTTHDAPYIDAQGNRGTRSVQDGVPDEYALRGAITVPQYQQMAAADLSDKQIAAQREIADQQNALNVQQFQAQQDQYAQQQKQVQDQAERQTAYDTGRSQLLGEGTQKVNDAFASFSPDYFQKYANDYMSKAQDQIDYQKQIAQKALAFGLARQGISSSQAGINQAGLLQETSGRATAEQTAAAQQAANQLQSNVAQTKQNLLGQVQSSESIGSPIAGSNIQDVNNALQTQRSAITGLTSTAGDTVSSLQGVPQVNSIGDIFAGLINTGSSLYGGLNAGGIAQQAALGRAGSPSAGDPSAGSTKK
jgi:hypothetical protein